jgi:hypothetical protein
LSALVPNSGVNSLCLIALAHRVLEVLTALQLQIMAPSSLSSHLKPDLQLPDFCNSMQFLPPVQAHQRWR